MKASQSMAACVAFGLMFAANSAMAQSAGGTATVSTGTSSVTTSVSVSGTGTATGSGSIGGTASANVSAQ